MSPVRCVVMAAWFLSVSVGAAHAQPVFSHSWPTSGRPFGLAPTSSGTLVYSTNFRSTNPTAFEVTPDGQLVREIGPGYPLSSFSLAERSDGKFVVAGWIPARLRLHEATGAFASQLYLGPCCSQDPFGERSCSAYLALDENDDMWFTDDWNSRIQKVTAAGQLVVDWSVPGGVAGMVYLDGLLYVARRSQGRIDVMTTQGAVVRSFPTGTLDDRQLAADDQGRLYLTDSNELTNETKVVCFTTEGQHLWTLTANVPGYAFGPMRPVSVAVLDGKLYVGDMDHERVLVFEDLGTPAAPTTWGAVKRSYR